MEISYKLFGMMLETVSDKSNVQTKEFTAIQYESGYLVRFRIGEQRGIVTIDFEGYADLVVCEHGRLLVQSGMLEIENDSLTNHEPNLLMTLKGYEMLN